MGLTEVDLHPSGRSPKVVVVPKKKRLKCALCATVVLDPVGNGAVVGDRDREIKPRRVVATSRGHRSAKVTAVEVGRLRTGRLRVITAVNHRCTNRSHLSAVDHRFITRETADHHSVNRPSARPGAARHFLGRHRAHPSLADRLSVVSVPVDRQFVGRHSVIYRRSNWTSTTHLTEANIAHAPAFALRHQIRVQVVLLAILGAVRTRPKTGPVQVTIRFFPPTGLQQRYRLIRVFPVRQSVNRVNYFWVKRPMEVFC